MAAWMPLQRADRDDPLALLSTEMPVIDLLGDALLVDDALQLLGEELRDYESFCRVRQIAAEFAGGPGFTRERWLSNPRVALFQLT